jgi:hypothetical protein
MFLTEDQIMKILKDEAMFSQSLNARSRSVRELATAYGSRALPIILEVLDTIPRNDEGFKAVCLQAIAKIKQEPDDHFID